MEQHQTWAVDFLAGLSAGIILLVTGCGGTDGKNRDGGPVTGGGGAAGSAGATGGGGGKDAGPADATSGYCINGATFPPAQALITDFSDAVPDSNMSGQFRFGGGTAGRVQGGTGVFSGGGFLTPPTLAVTAGALSIAAQGVSTNTSTEGYLGASLYFDGPACVDGSAFTGVAFDLMGDLGNCEMDFEFQFADDTGVANQDPERALCDASICYAPLATVTSTGTIQVPYTAPVGGTPDMVVDSRKLTGISWSFTARAPGNKCQASVTIDNVRFYSGGVSGAGGAGQGGSGAGGGGGDVPTPGAGQGGGGAGSGGIGGTGVTACADVTTDHSNDTAQMMADGTGDWSSNQYTCPPGMTCCPTGTSCQVTQQVAIQGGNNGLQPVCQACSPGTCKETLVSDSCDGPSSSTTCPGCWRTGVTNNCEPVGWVHAHCTGDTPCMGTCIGHLVVWYCQGGSCGANACAPSCTGGAAAPQASFVETDPCPEGNVDAGSGQ